MKIDLTRNDGTPAGWIEWDQESGEISGPLADEVGGYLELAKIDGSVPIHPMPSEIPITDPTGDPKQFAAVIGYRYRLPDELRALYPQFDDDEDELDPRLRGRAIN